MEERIVEWATAAPGHEPGRPDKSIEYRIMTGDFARSSGNHGDGGMERACARYGEDIRRQARVAQVHAALKRLRRYDSAAFEALVIRYVTRPGFRITAAQSAKAAGIGESQWRRNHDRGMAFLAGALEE